MTDILSRLGGAYLARLGAAHRHRQQVLALLLRDRLRRLWRFVDAGRAIASWARVSALAVALTAAMQAEAARGVDEYVAAALTAQGVVTDPAGVVAPAALSGYAADGRTLAGLLGYPAFQVDALVAQGMDGAQALAIGRRHLDRIVMTEVADTARTATGLAIVADRAASGWIRMVNLPSCSRCVILAGLWYPSKKGAGFDRHPQCDCYAVPAAEVVEPPSPKALFDAMDDVELREAGWSDADVKAIRDGADLYQVTNARRAMYSVTLAGQQLKATRIGARRRALRLTPDAIYAEASRLDWTRDQLIDVLRKHRYII